VNVRDPLLAEDREALLPAPIPRRTPTTTAATFRSTPRRQRAMAARPPREADRTFAWSRAAW
jgi:hypothetical protein